MSRIGIEPILQHLQCHTLPLSYLDININIIYLEIMEFESIQLRCKLRILTN